jgi:hypothetical protein
MTVLLHHELGECSVVVGFAVAVGAVVIVERSQPIVVTVAVTLIRAHPFRDLACRRRRRGRWRVVRVRRRPMHVSRKSRMGVLNGSFAVEVDVLVRPEPQAQDRQGGEQGEDGASGRGAEVTQGAECSVIADERRRARTTTNRLSGDTPPAARCTRLRTAVHDRSNRRGKALTAKR